MDHDQNVGLAMAIIIFSTSIIAVLFLALRSRPLKINLPSWLFNGRKTRVALDHNWIPAIGAVFMFVCQTLSIEDAWKIGVVGEGHLRPWEVLIVFFSLVYLSVCLDKTGALSFLALRVASYAKSSKSLFLLTFLTSSILTSVTSNDIVILILTPLVIKLCEIVNLDPKPFLFAQFFAANTASMGLLFGNPTNLILGQAYSIDPLTYTKWMLLPTCGAVVTTFICLRVYYSNRLGNKTFLIPDLQPRSSLKDLRGAVIMTIILVLFLLLMFVSPYAGMPLWPTAVISAGLAFLYSCIAYPFRVAGAAQCPKAINYDVESREAENGVDVKSTQKYQQANIESSVQLAVLNHDHFRKRSVSSTAAIKRENVLNSNIEIIGEGLEVVTINVLGDKQFQKEENEKIMDSDHNIDIGASNMELGAANLVILSEKKGDSVHKKDADQQSPRFLPPNLKIPMLEIPEPEIISSPLVIKDLDSEPLTAMSALLAVPWGLAPFLLGMFVMVEGLAKHGITDWLAETLSSTGNVNGTATKGFASASTSILFSVLGANLVNNQPAGILLSKSFLSSAFTDATSLSGAQKLGMVFAAIAGTNLAANVTIIGALAGVIFTKMARSRGILIGAIEFTKLGLAVTPFVVLSVVIILWIETGIATSV